MKMNITIFVKKITITIMFTFISRRRMPGIGFIIAQSHRRYYVGQSIAEVSNFKHVLTLSLGKTCPCVGRVSIQSRYRRPCATVETQILSVIVEQCFWSM